MSQRQQKWQPEAYPKAIPAIEAFFEFPFHSIENENKRAKTNTSENAWIMQFFSQPIRSQQGWSFRCSLQAKRIQVVLRRL